VDFKLDRNASTVTFYTYPGGTEVSLDGRPSAKPRSSPPRPLPASGVEGRGGQGRV